MDDGMVEETVEWIWRDESWGNDDVVEGREIRKKELARSSRVGRRDWKGKGV